MIFKLLLITHLVGDFIVQPEKLANLKNNKKLFLIVHALIYTFVNALILSLFCNILEFMICIIGILSSHFLIDLGRVWTNKRWNSNKKLFLFFIIDQILHILVLLVISIFIKSDLNTIGKQIYAIQFLKDIGFNNIANYVLAFVLVLTPASIFIKYFFLLIFNITNNSSINTNKAGEEVACYQVDVKNDKFMEKQILITKKVENETYNSDYNKDNAGTYIGMLERIIILLLGILGLYGSIALVLTAKSLARFKQLEDKSFSEKYLVGTLMSLIIAILALFIIM